LPPLVIATKGDIMTRVYGGCVEPDGLDLDNDLQVIACPKCDGEAYERFWAACEGGSIHQYHTIICTECGHAEGDLPDSYFEDPIGGDPRHAELEASIAVLGY